MKYLIDTDLVVDWLNGHEPSVQLVAPLIADGVALSILTYSEIYEGIYGGRDPRAEERVFRAFLRSVSVLPIRRAVAKRRARIRRDLRSRNLPVDNRALDLFIAATALEHGLTLLTRNRKDYADIPGLALLP
jgi:tRNA(fMet)-specific endonuclease VapC